MPLLLRASLPEPPAAILIAACSGRALAAAARRAGFCPLVADFFGDTDTQMIAAASCQIEDGLESGFCAETLLPALERLARGMTPCGLVYGAGFEDRAELLELLAGRWRLFGNAPWVVRQVKDPFALARLCAALAIPHPEVRACAPSDQSEWLAKSAGGSGGCHIGPAEAAVAGGQIYFQRIAEGEPVSILFLADGTHAQTVGFSRQWTAPAPGMPYRFGGSVRPADLPERLADGLRQVAGRVTSACGLTGLNGIDFLVSDRTVTLIEVNPRPGATLDIFEDKDGALLKAHLSACLGHLPAKPLEFPGAVAAATAYARREVRCSPELAWPYWAADRQKARSALRPNDPFCTVKARAITAARARARAGQRAAIILDRLHA